MKTDTLNAQPSTLNLPTGWQLMTDGSGSHYALMTPFGALFKLTSQSAGEAHKEAAAPVEKINADQLQANEELARWKPV